MNGPVTSASCVEISIRRANLWQLCGQFLPHQQAIEAAGIIPPQRLNYAKAVLFIKT